MLIFLLGSCVSKKKYTALKLSNETLNSRVEELRRELEDCRTARAALQAGNDELRAQNKELSVTNAALLNNVGNMVTLSAKEAENLERSLESIKEKDLFNPTVSNYLENIRSIDEGTLDSV